MEATSTELTASWSGLDASAKKELWLKVMARVDQIRSTSDVRYITHDPIDRLLPFVQQLMERKLVPCGREVALEAVGLACQILRCKRPEGDVLEGYIALLQEYPRDLLVPSIKQAIEQERYHVLPTPGALLAAALVQMRERKDKLMSLQMVLRRLSVSRLFSQPRQALVRAGKTAATMMAALVAWEVCPSMPDPPERQGIGFLEANGVQPLPIVIVNRLGVSRHFKIHRPPRRV